MIRAMTVAAPATPSVRSSARPNWLAGFWASAVGKKAVMAVTGIFLFGWIFAHMLGNLKIYLGSEHFNEYAKWLRTMGAPAVPIGGSPSSKCRVRSPSRVVAIGRPAARQSVNFTGTRAMFEG